MAKAKEEDLDVQAIKPIVLSSASIKNATDIIRKKHAVNTPERQKMIQLLSNWDDTTRFTPTGFREIDDMLGGGIPSGKLIQVHGYEGSGKSSLCFHFASLFDFSVYIDAESKFTKERAKFFHIDEKRMIVICPDTGEFAIDAIKEYAAIGVPLIIVDSVPSLIPQKQMTVYEKEASGTTPGVALTALLLARHLSSIASVCKSTGSTVLFVNQLRDKIGMTFGFGDTTYKPGGKNLQYMISQDILVQRKGKLRSSDSILGIRIGMAAKKNQVAAPYGTAEVNLIFDIGIRTIETEKEDLKAARKRFLDERKKKLSFFGKSDSEEIDESEEPRFEESIQTSDE